MLQEIYDKIASRGWSLYTMTDRESVDDIIPRGAAACLEPGKQYLVLPIVQDPLDVGQVMSAMEQMRQQGVYPLINYKGDEIAFALFQMREEDVLIRAQEDFVLSHAQLNEALDTLVDRSS